MWQPFIVDSDTVYFRFSSGAGETFWGYKFTITPVTLRLSDQQALNSENFELGYWLLELLLEHGPPMVRKTFMADLYQSLLFYVNNSKRSAKSRGTQLLLRVLQVPVKNMSLTRVGNPGVFYSSGIIHADKVGPYNVSPALARDCRFE